MLYIDSYSYSRLLLVAVTVITRDCGVVYIDSFSYSRLLLVALTIVTSDSGV